MSQADKNLVLRYYELVDAHRFDEAAVMLAPDVIGYFGAAPPTRTREEFCNVVKAIYTVFPDIVHEFREVIAEAGLVVTAGIWTGTHREPFQGIAAPGARVQVTVIHIDRVAGGVDHRALGCRGFTESPTSVGGAAGSGPQAPGIRTK
jgi:predicted ester cyclase